MSSKQTDPQLFEISKKLDILIRLFALYLVRDIKTQKERVKLLSDAGLQPKQIAHILGISRNNVNVILHSIRKDKDVGQIEETDSELLVKPTNVDVGGEQKGDKET